MMGVDATAHTGTLYTAADRIKAIRGETSCWLNRKSRGEPLFASIVAPWLVEPHLLYHDHDRTHTLADLQFRRVPDEITSVHGGEPLPFQGDGKTLVMVSKGDGCHYRTAE